MIGRQTVNIDAPWYFRRFIRNTLGQATRSIAQAQKAARSAIEEAPLFVADTRPAMFFGVPHTMSVLLILAFGESIVFFGPLYAFWVIIPWIAAMQAVRKDYNMPRIIVLWLQTKAIAFDARTWFGAAPAPFPLSNGKYPRGIWP
jgi:type IV secretion system protein VirB3